MTGPNRVAKFVVVAKGLATLAEADTARSTDVTIHITGENVNTICLAVRTLVALALRCCMGTIHLQLADSSLSAANAKVVQNAAQHEAVAYGNLLRLQVDDGQTHGLAFVVGPQKPGFYSMWADGWVAHINRPGPCSNNEAFAPAIVFAASAIMGKAFSVDVLENAGHFARESWSFDTLRQIVSREVQDVPQKPSSLGRIALLGAGAIGTAFAYTLLHTGIPIDVTIIDYDQYDGENLDTSLLIHDEDCNMLRPKAEVLSMRINGAGIVAQPIVRKLDDHDPLLKDKFNAFVVGVDKATPRRQLDASAADCIINAGLGGSRLDAGHVMVSHHIPGSVPLSHLYADAVDDELNGNEDIPRDVAVCSRLFFQQASLAAPFMGAAAGALLVAMVAAKALHIPGAAYLKLDLLRYQECFARREFRSPLTAH
jgi:ThiF family